MPLDALPLGGANGGEAAPDVADVVIAGLDARAVSRHLKVLAEAGLVDEHREGTRHLFLVNPGGFSAVQEFLADFWTHHLGQLTTALQPPGGPTDG